MTDFATNEDVKAKVEWFLTNLDLQLEDLRLEEEGVRVKLYFDTHDVRDAVLGMQAFYHLNGSFDSELFKNKRTLVRCLATSGWLGKIEMLPPHQAEFLTLMNINFGFSDELDDQALVIRFLSDVQAIMGTEAVDIKTLGKISEDQSEDDLVEFVQQVRKQAQSAEIYFSALESIGPWRSRMARWLREQTLRLESQSFNFGSMLASPQFRALKEAFDARRPSFNRMNNFADAVAVSILIDQVAAFRNGSLILPRFFVPSSLFHEAVERAGMLDSLSYSDSERILDAKGSVSPKSALTFSDYFIFKSLFRPSSERIAKAKDFAPLDLRELRPVVADILETQGHLTERTIRSIEVSGRPLSAIIDEVKQFSFLKNIWLQFIEMDYVKRVTDLQRQAHDLAHLRTVKKAIQATKEAIKDSAKEYKRVSNLWRELEQATSNLQARVKHDPSRPLDAFRDFGLLRFGFPSSSHEAIRSIVEPIFSGGEAEQIAARNAVITACYAEPTNLMDAEEATNLIRAAAVMWLARMDVQLFRLLETVQQSRPLPHFSLELIYAAAAFRLAKQLDKGQVVLNKLTNEYAGIPSRDRERKGDLAVGIAYLFFHLWLGSGYRPIWFPPADPKARPKKQEGKQLINHAIAYAKRAYDIAFHTELPKRAYALNQRLYYLVMGAGDDLIPEMESVAVTLMAFKADHSLWQYRFDDTLARYFHRLATIARTEESWGNLMKQARHHFDERTSFDFGDEQVQFYGTVLAVDETLGFGRPSLSNEE
jgi:ribosomal protein L32E